MFTFIGRVPQTVVGDMASWQVLFFYWFLFGILCYNQRILLIICRMDIEFVEEKYRDDIFKLMEVCGIEMAEAYELYVNAGNSFEVIPTHNNRMQCKCFSIQALNKTQQPKPKTLATMSTGRKINTCPNKLMTSTRCTRNTRFISKMDWNSPTSTRIETMWVSSQV